MRNIKSYILISLSITLFSLTMFSNTFFARAASGVNNIEPQYYKATCGISSKILKVTNANGGPGQAGFITPLSIKVNGSCYTKFDPTDADKNRAKEVSVWKEGKNCNDSCGKSSGVDCVNPLFLKYPEDATNLRKLTDMAGKVIVKEEVDDWKSCKPAVEIGDFASFGSHVSYVLKYEYPGEECPRSYTVLIYDGKEIDRATVGGRGADESMQPMPPSISNLQLFGNNIFYSKGDEYGEFSPKKYYFNSKLIPLTPAGGPACTLSTDSVLCSDENRNLNLNSKNIGETSRDVWNLVDYSYNGISANDNPFLFRNNVAWFDNNMDVKFLSAGGAIKDMGPGYQIYLFGNHLGIVREPKDSFSKSFSAGGFTASNGDHIIYDGKDIGPGSGIVLFGDQIAYTYFKATDNGLLLPYIIVNGESLNVLKELSLEKYISASTDVFGLDLFDDHFLFYMSLPTSDPNKMSIHLFYDWKDVGTVEDTSNSSNSIMFGDHLVIEKDGHIIYDGKDLGSGSAPLLFENHIGFKVDDPDGMLKPYYLDGQTYLYGNNNISANLKTCYKYYLENDVPVSGNNVETNNTDAVSSIGSSVNEKNNSVNNVGSSGTQYGSDINNGDQAELDNTGVGNSTQSPNMDNGEGYTQLETDSGSSNQALSQNDQIAETIDAVKIPITQDLSKEIPEVYSSDSIPTLKDGEVLIKGRSTALGIEGMELNSSRQDMKVNDTYYLVDKNTLPTDYILSGISSIKVGDSIIPIYNISTKDDVLARNTQYDKDGVFKFDFNNSPSATNPTMRLVNSIAQTVDTSLNVLGKVPTTLIMSNPLIALSLLAGTASGALPSNDAIMGHIALNSYNKDADVTLAKFADIDTYSVQSGATQGQKEESVYNVVNNNIKFQDPARGLSNTLEQAVATGSGVCRDKTPALVAGLNAVGIPAAQVVSDGHTFAAVLNTDGSVNHYLDPMYYETYLPLQRPSVNANQIIKK